MSDGAVRIDVELDTSAAEQQLDSFGNSAANNLNEVGNNRAFTNLSDEAVSFAGKASMAIAATAVAFGGFAIKSAGDMAALEAQFEQVFDGVGDAAQSSLDRIAKETHMLPNRLKGSFTQMAAFAKTTGMNTADALSLTERATMAAADSAAFYDRSIEDVTESLQSFLKGNYENDAALGISATETTRNAAANDLYGKSFKDLDEAQKQLTLLKMVEEGNQLSGALGQAAREADGMENVLGNLKQAGVDLAAAFGAPILDTFLGMVNKASSAMASFAEKLRENPALVYAIVGAVGTLVAALGAVYVAANAAQWLATLKAALIGTSTSMGLLTNPIFLVVAAIGLLITAFVYAYNRSETFRNGIDKLIGPIKNVLSGIKLLATGFKEMMTNGPGEKIAELREQFLKLLPESLWQGMINFSHGIYAVRDAIVGVSKIVSGSITNLTELGDFFEGTFTEETEKKIMAIGESIRDIIQPVKDAYSGAKLLASGFKEMITNGPGEKVAELRSQFIELFPESLWQGMINFAAKINDLKLGISAIGKIASGSIQTFGQLGDFLGGAFSYEGERKIMAIGKAIADLGNSVKTYLSDAINTVKEFGSAIINAFKTGDTKPLIDSFSKLLPMIISIMMGGLPKLILMGSKLISNIASGMGVTIPELIEKVSGVITDLIEQFAIVLPELLQVGIDILLNIIEGIVSMIPVLLPIVMQIFTTFISTATEFLPIILEAGIQVLMALIEGIVQVLPVLIEAGLQVLMALLGAIIENLPVIIDAGIQILSALIEGIIQILPSLLDAAIQILTAFIAIVIESLPQIIEAGIQLLMALIDGIVQVLPDLIGAAIQLMLSLLGTLISYGPDILGAGIQLIWELIKGILQVTGELLAAGGQLMLDLLAKLGEFLGDMLEKGAEIIGNFVEGVASGIIDIITTAGEIGSSIIDELGSIDLFDIGKNIIQGLIDGIGSMVDSVISSISNVAGSIKDKVAGALGIHSPSRWMRDMIGKNMMLGWEIGIDKNSKSPIDAVADTVGTIQDIIAKGTGDRNGNLFDHLLDGNIQGLNLNMNPALTGANITPASNIQKMENRVMNTQELPPVQIETVVNLDGKEVGKGTAVYVQEANENRSYIRRKIKGES